MEEKVTKKIKAKEAEFQILKKKKKKDPTTSPSQTAKKAAVDCVFFLVLFWFLTPC